MSVADCLDKWEAIVWTGVLNFYHKVTLPQTHGTGVWQMNYDCGFILISVQET